jgi:tetratricopeptide (TPR) repeat protein
MIIKPALFISYRRTHLPQVQRISKALECTGIECFLDVESIHPLADFPDRIREAIGRCHVFLAWWSTDYCDSDHCLQEFRIAWQHTRRLSSDLVRRIWIVNPQERGDHVFAGELDSKNFLKPPSSAGDEGSWAQMLLQRIQSSNLIAEGPLADERMALPSPTLHSVPEKSPQFTGRGAELMRIHSKLHPARLGDQGSAAAVQIHGLGGVGKTELGIAYAREFSAAYPGGVYWLNLASWQPVGADQGGTAANEQRRIVELQQGAELAWLRALEQTCRMQPQSLSNLTRDADGKELPAAAVRERLAQHLGERGDYLWVLDNVPELSPLSVRARILQFLRAPNGRGHTLLTTRDSRPAEGFASESLDVPGPDDALRLLAKFRPSQAQEELPAMRKLIAELGAHTQALMLLGEYARNEPDGYFEVLRRLKTAGSVRRIEEIAASLRELLGEQARGIVATFALSIEPLGESAKEVLSLASVCTPNVSIPDALLAEIFGRERADDFNQALGAILRTSLLQRRQAAGRGVFIHPLVAETAVSLLEIHTRVLQRRVADGLLRRVANAGDIRVRLAMHEDIEQARDLGGKLEDQRGVRLLHRVGQFEQAGGRYAGARMAETQALDLARRVLGEEHPDTLTVMRNLARTLQVQGDLNASYALQTQALSICQRTFGEEHPDTLSSLNYLAATLQEQGDLGAARMLQEHVLSTRRRLLGEEHIDTLRSMNALGGILVDLGNLGAAQVLQEQALSICRRVLGEEHHDTLVSINNFANTLLEQGDLDAARTLQEQLLAISRRVLGDEHPGTLSSMANLASTLSAQGHLDAARALQEQVLSIRRRTLGEEHLGTLTSMNNLAWTLGRQGNLNGARALQEQALSIRRRTLGEEHLDTLTSMNNLAATLQAQGDLGAARMLQEQALPICRRVLGEEHSVTLGLMSNLATTLETQGDLGAALALQEQAMLICRRVLGDNHPNTSILAWNLVTKFLRAGESNAANKLLQSTLLWLLERDPSSLGGDQRLIRGYVSGIHKQLGMTAS